MDKKFDKIPGPTQRELDSKLLALREQLFDLMKKLSPEDRRKVIKSMSDRIAQAIASPEIPPDQIFPEMIKITLATIEFLTKGRKGKKIQ